MTDNDIDVDSDLDTKCLWNCLETFPFQFTQFMRSFSSPFDTIIAVPEQKEWEFDMEPQETGDGIYEYIVGTNGGGWIKLFDYPQTLTLNCHSATFDTKNRIIFILTQKQLWKYKMDNNLGLELLMDDLNFEEFPISHMCVVNDIVHIVDGNIHCTFDPNANTMTTIHQFRNVRDPVDFIGPHGKGLIHLKLSNSFMLFERRNKDIMIHQYEIKTAQWTESKMITNSKTINEIFYAIYFNPTNDTIATSVVATTTCDHIIFLNGMNKAIYVFDTNTKVICGSNIKVPDSDIDEPCYLTVTRDEYVDKLFVFGWLRQVVKMINIEVPVAIQQIIFRNICNETLHVIEFMMGEHWGICVDDIIQSVKSV
eukprot:251443_1